MATIIEDAALWPINCARCCSDRIRVRMMSGTTAASGIMARTWPGLYVRIPVLEHVYRAVLQQLEGIQ